MEWVSIKDRIPEEDKSELLLWTDSKEICMGKFINGARDCHCISLTTRYRCPVGKVTHWMICPETRQNRIPAIPEGDK